MHESVIYQDILQEGWQEGKQRGIEEGRKLERVALLQKIIPFVRQCNVPIDLLLELVGVTEAELEQAESEVQE
ncbi:MAG: hypothetical protein AAGG51_18315 [Cyanobacteria bacterium P01_G01_bin.54]